MIIQLLQSADISSLILVTGLIAAFVIAFKVMEMIFDTLLISGISAAFYIGLRTIQGGPISINDVLLFTFLGASLYMTYGLLASLYKLGATVLPIPYHMIQTAVQPLEYVWNKLEDLSEKDDYAPDQTNSEKKQKEKEKEDKDKSEQSTKEVILGNKKEKEKEDEE